MLRLDGPNGKASQSAHITALPYIDGLTPEARQNVDALIQQEMRNSVKRPADFLKELGPEPAPKFDDHPLLAAEIERVQAKQPMKPLDTSRYRLDTPGASKQNDYGAWHSSLDNANAQLEHQYLRIMNLELLLKYGDKTWRAQAQMSEATSKQMEEDLHSTKRRITELNQERKLSQMAAGAELRKLNDEYFEAVKKNLDIDNACEKLQDEVDQMRTKVEALAQQQQQQQAQQQPEIEGEQQDSSETVQPAGQVAKEPQQAGPVIGNGEAANGSMDTD